MSETPEAIKQQIEETMAHLALKLDELKVQVTLEAVAEVVTVIKTTMHSAVAAKNIRSQVTRHPWWVLGGSTALTCLFLKRFLRSAKRHKPKPVDLTLSSVTNAEAQSNAMAFEQSAIEPNEGGSHLPEEHRHELRDAVMNSFVKILPEVTSQVVPWVVERIVDKWASTRNNDSDRVRENQCHISSINPQDASGDFQNNNVEKSHRIESAGPISASVLKE